MTDTPPICSYEGSDYPTSFWEQGGRAYEDECESNALLKLLPKGGSRMLELGAGGGRNTLKYSDFDQIVLLDYSVSQLEHAQKRLGKKTCYRFIAADIYRLPFMPGAFDCATMIRTLHHMANPRQALEQVHGTLQKDAHFILEYANKRNLKAILRYWLRRQDWNPFSPEPVEFAELNYDFHPRSIRRWLAETGFRLGANPHRQPFQGERAQSAYPAQDPGLDGFRAAAHRSVVSIFPQRVHPLKGGYNCEADPGRVDLQVPEL